MKAIEREGNRVKTREKQIARERIKSKARGNESRGELNNEKMEKSESGRMREEAREKEE